MAKSHQESLTRWIGAGKTGVEIGPGESPLPGLDPHPIYVDCFESFGAKPCLADFYGHACALPFHDHSLDYVISSHVLEHVANPIAALAEWYRVLRPGGIIYSVVPDRRMTWEHTRGLTTVEHMLEDYVRGTTACDASHIDEFVFEADWSRYCPTTPPAEVPGRQAELARGMHEAVARGEDINIHFHTFEPSNFRALLEKLTTWRERRFNWDIVEFEDYFPGSSPNGILAVIRVNQGWHARAKADAFRVRAEGDPHAVLRDDAEPFAVWAAKAVESRKTQ